MPALATVPHKLPTHLAQAPLAEAIFEFRFKPVPQTSVAQLLPGLVFAKLHDKYDRSEATPVAGIPEQIRKGDPNLRYAALHRLSGEKSSVFIGEQVAGVSVIEPYEGWQRFRPRILEFLEIARASNLIERVERFSIKAINLIPSTSGQQLDLLNLRLEIGGIRAPETGFHFRTELNDKAFSRIIEIQPNTQIQFTTSKTTTGLLLSLDCVKILTNEDFWSAYATAINDVHNQLKELFFGLITQKTLESLEPSYE